MAGDFLKLGIRMLRLRVRIPLWIFTALGMLILSSACSEVQVKANQTVVPFKPHGWKLAWNDEFDGPAGTPVNEAYWVYDLGGNGWGNKEKQFYTSDPQNIALNGKGQLVITARVASAGLTCYYGACKYTSARVKTTDNVEPRYGRIEARIKLPVGQGLWPAFWMLGHTDPPTTWPDNGEIDIMEYKGSLPGFSSSALHGPGYAGNTLLKHRFSLPDGAFSDDFHLFAVEWDAEQVRFYVDETLHYSVAKEKVQQYGDWVFDQPFYILLNLAVGGNYDGDPLNDDIFPASMQVDYVRVYERIGEAPP